MLKKDWDHIGDKIGYVCDLIEELLAREITNNCIHKDLTDVSWEELCEGAIELLEEIKVGW